MTLQSKLKSVFSRPKSPAIQRPTISSPLTQASTLPFMRQFTARCIIFSKVDNEYHKLAELKFEGTDETIFVWKGREYFILADHALSLRKNELTLFYDTNVAFPLDPRHVVKNKMYPKRFGILSKVYSDWAIQLANASGAAKFLMERRHWLLVFGLGVGSIFMGFLMYPSLVHVVHNGTTITSTVTHYYNTTTTARS